MRATPPVEHLGASPGAVADAGGRRVLMSPIPGVDASLVPRGDGSLKASKSPSPGAALDGPPVVEVLARRCWWCRCLLEQTLAKYCSKKCRQTAYRFRKLAIVEGQDGEPKRLCYADPPYIGLSLKYYSDEPSYRGEVDHVALVRDLLEYDGWALSCSQESLPYVLRLIPPWVKVEVCPWVKVVHRSKGRGPLNIHEYVVAVPARRRFPGVPDALVCSVARGGDSTLMGRKPIKFVSWLFELLGILPCDSLDDRFPGSEVVTRCWNQLRSFGSEGIVVHP